MEKTKIVYFKLVFIVMIFFSATGCVSMIQQYSPRRTSWCNTQRDNQNVLVNSKIKENFFPIVFREIKKTLPKQLKKCPIIVADIKLLKAGNDRAEDWTVDICQETKVYFVYAYWLKGSYLCIVKPKGEQFVKEKEIWDAAKKFGDEETWRKALFYVDEIETMEQVNHSTKVK
ncbi:MAG TPA: hypothetical protein PLT76_08935 [Candidatus Omnitrophota bacterium]|nr:hypothetical protein [Candidatus Omnitrophota bacterium]HQQ88385.1 hypothetical protein [Smithellaceae bacterium]